MRLLLAMMEEAQSLHIQRLLYAQGLPWDIAIARDGADALDKLLFRRFDLLAIQACLPCMDGISVLKALWAQKPVCAPRVLLLCEREMLMQTRPYADCTVPLCTSPSRVASLLCVLAKKPLPMLAAAQEEQVTKAVERFLDALGLSVELKGRAYAAWLLRRMVPSPAVEHGGMGALYAACAVAFSTTPAAVERCLRVAVESVFTQGSMRGIERFFGATVDPEKGKPTNRAFLLQAVQQLRTRLYTHSLADTRSLNSSDMHQSPAAPTMV